MAVIRKQRPKPGDTVIVTRIPPGFLDDLPIEDQRAISAVIGKPIVLNEYDDDGRAELQFKDGEGAIHFIYVNADLLTPVNQ